jgi:hypothetical protein
MRAFRFLLVNAALVVLILLAVNFLSALILTVDRAFEIGSGAKDGRTGLPVFADQEAASRIFDDFYRVRFDYQPYAGWRAVRYRGATTEIDENGRRVSPQPADRNASVVHFFGGSTTWGAGAGGSETIPAHFARLADVRTVNNGQSGFVSRQNLAALLNVIDRGERLDVAIFYDGVNDVLALCRSAEALGGHLEDARMRRDLRQSGVNRPWLWDTLFGATVPFLTKAVNKAAAIAGRAPLIGMPGQLAASVCQSDPTHAERVANAMIANWQRANLLLIYEGQNFIGVLQPVAFIGSARTDYLVLDESLRGNYEAVYPILRRKLAEQTEITVVDLTHIFDGGESVYMDWAHINGRGNELVAAALRDALLDLPGRNR